MLHFRISLMKISWRHLSVPFSIIFIFGAVHATYKINIVSVKPCDNVDESKMDKSVDLEYYCGVHKLNRQTSVIRANYTIRNEKIGPMMATFRCYEIQQSGVRYLAQVLNNVSCNSPLTGALQSKLNVKLDKDCYVHQGTYVVKDINLNDIAWIFTHHMVNVGRYAFDIEMATHKGIAACVTLTMDIIKRK